MTGFQMQYEDGMQPMGQHADMSPASEEAFAFEGPEKKLEVYFSEGSTAGSFRDFPEPTWDALLADASCTILHREQNEDFDAYLLSESSLFVYPRRVILKTCGTTTLLLVIPKLMAMAASLHMSTELLQYGHLRYKFPDQQVYPHLSLKQEKDYLEQHFSHVSEATLGGEELCFAKDVPCWHMLAVEPERQPGAPPAEETDDILEIAMEGLSDKVRQIFSQKEGCALPEGGTEAHRELSRHMTDASGLGALLDKVKVDDWAFEPVGYSMNGLRGGYYYTVHVTPESAFSYASFETNDPAFRDPYLLDKVIAVFEPSLVVSTFTTREVRSKGCDSDGLPCDLSGGFEVAAREVQPLGERATAYCTVHVRGEHAHMASKHNLVKIDREGTTESFLSFSDEQLSDEPAE